MEKRSALTSEFADLDVAPALEPVFFWKMGDHRRIVVGEWGQLKILGKRAFHRFVGGKYHWSNLQTTLHKLTDPGRPSAAVFGNHVLGYVRPWAPIGQQIEPETTPAMIARKSRRGFPLITPVLLPSVQEARDFLRELRDQREISPLDWRCYEGECRSEPMDKLFMSNSQGPRTQLEHDLVETFGPSGRERQALTRPIAVSG